MIILGIESTCDETAAAVVTCEKQILSNVLVTQTPMHQVYGGVVPEVAARAHLDTIKSIIRRALTESQLKFEDLSGIAVTAGPGLIGGLHVGTNVAKAIAVVHQLPFYAVNHLAAHALSVRLTHDVAFPYLVLLVSGGHTQLLICHGPQKFELLGTTIDDALGETFDKVARMLDLNYPGGPQIEALARDGDASFFKFPQPLLDGASVHSKFNFSFSGLKTAVKRAVENQRMNQTLNPSDIAASFQYTVGEVLINRCHHALVFCQDQKIHISGLIVAGGVAANRYLNHRLTQVCQKFSVQLICPPVHLCTDNAAMVAWAGVEKAQTSSYDSLDFEPRPRWPLEHI